MPPQRTPRPIVSAACAALAVGSFAGLSPDLAAAASVVTPATIPQIQGTTHLSPMQGELVADVPGIVTATNRTGFWMQSANADKDRATSEGLYVYTRSSPTVSIGDEVTVAGTVSEFRPGGSDGNDNLTTTQLIDPNVALVRSGAPLPMSVTLGVDRVAPPQRVAGDPGNVERSAALLPEVNAIDFYESLEGMRTGLRDAVATGPTNTGYGELPVVPGQTTEATRTPSNGVAYGSYGQPNAMRILLDDPLLPKNSLPAANVGDTLPGLSEGVLDYAFGNFKLLLTSVPGHRSSGLQREVTDRQTNNQLAVATFNVENLSPSDPASKYERLARQITTNLQAPDVLTLEEIQDNSGAKDDGVTSSSTTVTKLIDAVKAAGGPAYQARWIDPQDKADGGQPGGNIRNVFFYRPDRDVDFVDRPGRDATTASKVVGTGKRTSLSHSPGRIEPAHAAWDESRKPLAGEFRFRGKTYFVIANHFASKGGDDPLFGRWQQPTRPSEAQRHEQAQVVRGFVDKLLRADSAANVVVLGDFNDFEFSTTTDILVGNGTRRLTNLPRTLPPSQRYTYVFEGNSQVLDHILISPGLLKPPPGSQGPAVEYDIVHTNSEFQDQDSDHDPQVVRLRARGGK